jgi:hypothetical protein
MHSFLRMVLLRTCKTVGVKKRYYWQVEKDKDEGDEWANEIWYIKLCYDIRHNFVYFRTCINLTSFHVQNPQIFLASNKSDRALDVVIRPLQNYVSRSGSYQVTVLSFFHLWECNIAFNM